jgi:mannose-6-phosphate isomerase-like protein (cupin superfamily)
MMKPEPVNGNATKSEMDIIPLSDCPSFITKDGSGIRELLSHRNSSIRNQSLAEATIGPGVLTELHYHKVTEEIYFITRGTGVMTLGNRTCRVTTGDAIAIPPGQIHQILNDGDEDLVLLCCCAPGYEHSDTYLVSPDSLS